VGYDEIKATIDESYVSGKSNAINTCHDDVFFDVFLHADSVATDSAASAGKSSA